MKYMVSQELIFVLFTFMSSAPNMVPKHSVGGQQTFLELN